MRDSQFFTMEQKRNIKQTQTILSLFLVQCNYAVHTAAIGILTWLGEEWNIIVIFVQFDSEIECTR